MVYYTMLLASGLLDVESDGCRMMCAGVASFLCLGLEDGHVPTLWLLLYMRAMPGLDKGGLYELPMVCCHSTH